MVLNETNDDKNVDNIKNEGVKQLPLTVTGEGEEKDTDKEIKIELPNLEELSKSINRLSSKLGIEELPEESNEMYIGGKKGEKYISDDKNNKLSDLEIFKRSLKQIKNYETKYGRKAPVPPKFVAFMEDYVKVVGSGAMSAAYYKRNNIYREMPMEQITNLK